MELIVVIAIIGVLAAVLIPTFSGAIDSARQASDKSDVTHMNQELMIYKIQENVSSVDYHSALLWLTTNGYSLESSAKGYAYWFDEDAEQLVYAQVDEAISNANVASATGDGTDGIYDDPGKIAKNPNLTLIDRRTDNPIITAVNGIRNLVQEASSVGSAAGDINAQLATSFTAIVNEVGNDTVATYLNHFNPLNTLYITENGVYTGLTGTATTASAVVFSDTLRVIDKSTTGSPSYQVQSGAVIELPKTVALVMDGALSCIVPAADGTETVKITAEKAQFMEGSLDQAVKEASGIETLDNLEVTGGSINFIVTYGKVKEGVIEYADKTRKTFRVEAQEGETFTLTGAGTASDYGVKESGAKLLREYLVPTFEFNGSFSNVSGIDIQMKKDGDLVVFYGITYGKNGTISQIATFGYWTNINEGFADYENDKDATTRKYQYTSTDPLRGYSFPTFYEKLEIRAYSSETGKDGVALIWHDEGTEDAPKIIYRSPDRNTATEATDILTTEEDTGSTTDPDAGKYYAVKPEKFTVSSGGIIIYAEYIYQESTTSGSTEA